MSAREADAPRAGLLHPSAASRRHEAPSHDPGGPDARDRRDQVELVADGELIRLVGEGDHRAFGELYRRFARSVLGLALRRLRDRSRAEDATQETFAAIWRAAATYRPERGPGAPWLYAVARNAIVNQTRLRLELVPEVPDVPSDQPGPSEHAESDWLSRRVHRALRSLPAHERTLIELAYWSELSQSEIAARLNLPLGTVKTRTRSALGRLADLLERDELR
jgi:RNA polymerase sigma-70 factor (ECF subfamily)